MRKWLKITLGVIGILVSIVILDTLQARIFKHSPIISWKEELADEDSYVDRGIIIDTFYCIKEKDMQTIYWQFKGSKFTCPIDNVSISYLRELQEDITNILVEKKDYHNFAAIYVDEEKKLLIIELEDNSKEEQEWFRKNIMDSKYIKFEQGGPYYTMDGFDFYLSKLELYDNLKFKDYYKNNERTIYLAGNIEEFYIINEDKKDTLKNYVSLTYQTIDDSIKSITAKLDRKDILKDGGTTIYKSKEKDVTLIVCKTIDGNKDVFIGDFTMEYEQFMCK